MSDSQKVNNFQGSPFEIVNPSKPKKITPKSVAVMLLVLLFLGVSVFLGVYLVKQKTNVAERAAPATAMYVTPGSQTKAPGASFSFSVNVDTSTNYITGVDVRLTFNPAEMQIVSLEQGAGVANLNQTITNTYDNNAGTIAYAIFTLDSSKAVNGSGVEVLKVNATVPAGATTGSFNIAFDPATAASASQEGQNVLISKTQGTLVVSTSTGAATPTPTASPTPAPGATATPTPVVTPTPTPNILTDNNNCGSFGHVCTSGTSCVSGSCVNTGSSATATPTSVPTNAPTSQGVQTTPLPIPVTGTDWPTILGAGVGILTIVGAFLIAL